MTNQITLADLRQFTGTEHWYRHPLARRVLYTDGIHYLAEKAGAYWLVDDIAFAQCGIPAVSEQAFQVWKLTVRPDHSATLACEDGNDRVIITKDIAFTDFPLPEIILFFCNDTLLLPSEY
jgi:hypothetical protein